MKATWIVALLVLIGAGGYYWYSTQNTAVMQESAEPVAETSESTTTATESAEPVDGAVSLQTLLTPEGFDAGKLAVAIDAAEGVDTGLKQVLKQAVELAAQDPSIIPATIAQVKAGLGL